MSAIGAFSSTADEWITVTQEPKLSVGSGDFGISLWFKVSGEGELVSFGSGSGTVSLEIQNGGAVSASVAGTAVTSSASSYLDDTWHYVQLSIDRSREKLGLFVDLTYEETGFTGVTIGDSDIVIGAGSPPVSGENSIDGDIADVRMLNHALLPQTPTALPTCLSGDTPGTLMLLHMMESHGSTILDASSGALSADSTPSHASATITNFDADSTHWVVNGPVLAPPLILAKEMIIYAIDEDQDLLDYISQNRIDFHRSRVGDRIGYRTEMPQMSLVPLQIGPSSRIKYNFGWQGVFTTNRLMVHASPRTTFTPVFLEELEHLITRALFQRDKDTGSTFGCYSVNGWSVSEITVDSEGSEAGAQGPVFHMDITFEFLRDLRDSNQP